nr:SufC [Erythrotrichia longistipitata]
MTTSTLLEVRKLRASVDNNLIIKDLNLSVKTGEIHAIMGPNGSGKSSFSKIVAGHPAYSVDSGDIFFEGNEISSLEAHERSRQGIFLGFQYPVEIPGVSNADFLRLSYNEKNKQQGLQELDPLQFFELASNKLSLIGMSPNFLTRNVNEGFSGGEKKKNEILQLALLNSKLAILDETDSGLDIDALKIIGTNIRNLANNNNAIILITHYQRLLDYITPNFIHIMKNGRIVKTGGPELAHKLEKEGYESV